MNLDELQSVQARERQSSDLQHLRSSFYREVGEYIDELTDRRAELVAEAADPFSSPEVRQLSDDIETAEQTVEAIYERRVGKVVKKASIAAAGMPVDDDGLTSEEEALFDDLVGRIERNRETVLAVLDGEPPSAPGDADGAVETDEVAEPGSHADGASSESDRRDEAALGSSVGGGPGPATGEGDAVNAAPEPGADVDATQEGADEPVDAADLMGAGAGTLGSDDDRVAADEGEDEEHPREVPPADGPPGQTAPDDSDAGSDPSAATDPDGDAGDLPGLPRTTVRITADVGEIVGADDRDYDLSREDVVTLPEPNADVLVEKDAAERVE